MKAASRSALTPTSDLAGFSPHPHSQKHSLTHARIKKEDGRKEPVQFDKITARVKKLCYELHPAVDPVKVAMRVIEGVYDGVHNDRIRQPSC